MDVHVSSRAPRHLRISEGMLEDLIYDPVMAVWVFWRVRLDAFQGVRLREFWFTPTCEDSSGFTSAKTVVAWFCVQLRALLLGDQRCVAIYPTFQQGKENFWDYYTAFPGTALWRAQLGKLDIEGEEDGKGHSRGASSYKQHFKNGSQVSMPAPNFFQKGRTMAGMRYNTLYIDEVNKILSMSGGLSAVTLQLMGRVTRACYNQNHPIWCNHILLTSTAETGDHPGIRKHREIEREVKKGNPDYGTVSFCYKDYSNLRTVSGKTFREEFRAEKTIHNLKVENTREAFEAEGLGIWQARSKGWYSQEMLDRCRELGRARGLVPVLSRADDPAAQECSTEVRYFLGTDPAPAQKAKNDDGSLVVLRAILLPGQSGQYESDWQLDYVYARRARGLRAAEWSGLIHEKHGDFRFTLIVMDYGGGGQWVWPELRLAKQEVRGAPTQVRPIVLNESAEIEGDPILHLFRREDFKELWPDLVHARSDDVLKDHANTMFQMEIEKGGIGLPVEHKERKPEDLEGWVPEKLWASKLMMVLGQQMLALKVLMSEDGQSYRLTKNNSKQFYSSDKEDFHDGARNAYLAFRLWLLRNDVGTEVAEEDAAMSAGW